MSKLAIIEALQPSFPNQEQLMVIRNVLEGKSLSASAKDLEMSVQEATLHFKEGMKKAGLKSIRELVIWALRAGIISDPPREDLVNSEIEIGTYRPPMWVRVLAALTTDDKDSDIAENVGISLSNVKYLKNLIRQKFLLGDSDAILIRFAFQVIKPFIKTYTQHHGPWKPSTLKYGTLKYPPMYAGGFKGADIDPDIPVFYKSKTRNFKNAEEELPPGFKAPKPFSNRGKKNKKTITTKIQTALEILGIHPSRIYSAIPGSTVSGTFWERGSDYLWDMLELAKKRYDLEIKAVHSDKTGNKDWRRAAQLNAAWDLVRDLFAFHGYKHEGTPGKPGKAKNESILNEMPQITKKGKDLYAGEQLLRSVPVKAVRGNLVFIREERKGGFIAEGWSVVYFMDSEESAQAMATGKMDYLLVPQGTFFSGGSPITDVWKKRFQKPGHEHILGILQCNTMPNSIVLDMLTVRPGYQRNTIAQKMVQLVMQQYPEAEVYHTSPTDKGRRFLKKNQLLEPRYQTPEDREDMVDDQIEGQLDESFHDYAKLEAYYRTDGGSFSFWFFRNGLPAGEIQMIAEDGYMIGFGVHRSLQGTGLGRAMLKYAFEKTGKPQLKFASSAHAFYHKVGGRRDTKGRSYDFTLEKDKFKSTSLTFTDIDKDTAISYLQRGRIDTHPSRN